MVVSSKTLQQKNSLRKQVIAKRNEIDEGARVAKSHLICDQLLELLDTHTLVTAGSLNRSFRIAVYQAMGSEVDLRKFILAAYGKGMSICFPCMTTESPDATKPWLKGRRMLFYEVSEADYRNKQAVFLNNPLKLCAVEEVRQQGLLEVEPKSIDMVVVPIVAFDSDKYRLGYGGGNYDWFLSQVYAAKKERSKAAIVAGAAFIEQNVDCVPREKHDLQLPLILTA